MPNGYSGHFELDVKDLRDFLATVGREAIVATSPDAVDMTASTVLRRLEGLSVARVLVEEQYGEHFIIHAGDEPRDFLVVRESSPLHEKLKARL